MNLLLTEEQYDNLKKYDFYKKAFYRYWDKKGPGYDNLFMKIFQVHGSGITELDIEKMLVDYIGRDKAIEMAINNIEGEQIISEECGSYKFKYLVNVLNVENTTLHLEVSVLFNEEGSVYIDGEEIPLLIAIEDEDYGWEIENEIKDCVYGSIHEKVTMKTGIQCLVDHFEMF